MWLLFLFVQIPGMLGGAVFFMSGTRLIIWDTFDRWTLLTYLTWIPRLSEMVMLIHAEDFFEHFTRLGALPWGMHYPSGSITLYQVQRMLFSPYTRQRVDSTYLVYSIKLQIGLSRIRIWGYQGVSIMYLRRLWGCYSFTWIYLELMSGWMWPRDRSRELNGVDGYWTPF